MRVWSVTVSMMCRFIRCEVRNFGGKLKENECFICHETNMLIMHGENMTSG